MKWRFMSKNLLFLTVVFLWCALLGHAQTELLWSWTGEPIPGGQSAPPAVVEPTLGQFNELEFKGKQFLRVPLTQDNATTQRLTEFTISFYVYPYERTHTEDLVFLLNPAGVGFGMYKSWTNWGHEVRWTAEDHDRLHMNVRSGYLFVNEWQHVAMTYSSGVFSYYKDGFLITTRQIDMKSALQLQVPLDFFRRSFGGDES